MGEGHLFSKKPNERKQGAYMTQIESKALSNYFDNDVDENEQYKERQKKARVLFLTMT
jgi:hypothetical protein